MFKVLIYVSISTLLVSVTRSGATGTYGDWCDAPPLDRVTDFAWDSSGKANGGYYFPISSTSDLDIEEDMIGPHSAKCVRMNWSDDVVTVNYFYSLHGSGNAYFHCEQVHPPKNMWKCKHLRADDGTPDWSHTAWITLTDDHTYSFTVRCFHHTKKQGWVVFTTKKQLPRELTHRILDHAKSLGFPTLPGKDVVFRNYDDGYCAPICVV